MPNEIETVDIACAFEEANEVVKGYECIESRRYQWNVLVGCEPERKQSNRNDSYYRKLQTYLAPHVPTDIY